MIAFEGELSDVLRTDVIDIRSPPVTSWVEVASVLRIGVWAADEFDLDDVVGWDHSRVGRMELVFDLHFSQFFPDLVHLLSDDQAWAIDLFRQEVSHWPADGAS